MPLYETGYMTAILISVLTSIFENLACSKRGVHTWVYHEILS